MIAILDDSLVGLLLLASVLYALAALGPRIARRRMLQGLALLLARAPKGLGLASLAQRVARAAEGKAQGACGGCDTCGSEPKTQSSGAEIRVPIARIARARPPRTE